MTACFRSLCIAVIALGCAASQPDAVATGPQGMAELRIDARPLVQVNVTHVTVEAGGQSIDLTLNSTTGTFDGSLILPVGSQTLVAKAFSGTTLVGQSAPAVIDVQVGVVTRAMIRILSVGPDDPEMFGPIFDSLSFPTTAQAGAPSTLSLSVVAPAGDPVTYQWTSNCADSTFSAQAATTTWSAASQETCTIQVVATSNGQSISKSFTIVVFPIGSNSGAVTVNGVFVAKPLVQFTIPELGCMQLPDGSSAATQSCPNAIASPDNASYMISVISWGASSPGSLTVSSSCGGLFGTTIRSTDVLAGPWVPPVDGGLCVITAQITNSDNLTTTLSAAVLVRPGTPLPDAQPARFFGSIYDDQGLFYCGISSDAGSELCGSVAQGRQLQVVLFPAWGNGTPGGLPGSVIVSDSCAGSQTVNAEPGEVMSVPWTVPGTVGMMCTTNIRVTNLEGDTSQTALQYKIAAF